MTPANVLGDASLSGDRALRPVDAVACDSIMRSPGQFLRPEGDFTGSTASTKNGIVDVWPGGFGRVYKVETPGGLRAIKVFRTVEVDRDARYAAITTLLQQVRLRHEGVEHYLLDVTYRVEGILVPGYGLRPTLEAPWVEGDALDRYIARHVDDPTVLRNVATQLCALGEALKIAGIAHGDLQHANIMVAGGRLVLVDYDGMYVPDFVGKDGLCVSPEAGHPDYRHPRRTTAHAGPTLDNFSLWVIYLSVVALSVTPHLWAERNADAEYLLLQQRDFNTSTHESAFNVPTDGVLADLCRSTDSEVRDIALHVREFLFLTNPLDVPSLVDAALIETPVSTPMDVVTVPQIPDRPARTNGRVSWRQDPAYSTFLDVATMVWCGSVMGLALLAPATLVFQVFVQGWLWGSLYAVIGSLFLIVFLFFSLVGLPGPWASTASGRVIPWFTSSTLARIVCAAVAVTVGANSLLNSGLRRAGVPAARAIATVISHSCPSPVQPLYGGIITILIPQHVAQSSMCVIHAEIWYYERTLGWIGVLVAVFGLIMGVTMWHFRHD